MGKYKRTLILYNNNMRCLVGVVEIKQAEQGVRDVDSCLGGQFLNERRGKMSL